MIRVRRNYTRGRFGTPSAQVPAALEDFEARAQRAAASPRPLEPYGLAAMASMGGDRTVAQAALDQMLRERLSS